MSVNFVSTMWMNLEKYRTKILYSILYLMKKLVLKRTKLFFCKK